MSDDNDGSTKPAGAVLFDVDGTLADTNYLHVTAWWEAFRDNGHTVPMSRLHRLIGMGSSKLVSELLGEVDEQIVDGHTEHYKAHWDEIRPLPGAQEALRRVKKSGLAVVLASSASEEELTKLREVIDADDAIDHATSKDDAESSKPDPDIVEAALAAGDWKPERCVLIGDTVWDVEAAGRAGLPCIGVLTGGISEAELRDAGAVEVYADLPALLKAYDDSVIAGLIG